LAFDEAGLSHGDLSVGLPSTVYFGLNDTGRAVELGFVGMGDFSHAGGSSFEATFFSVGLHSFIVVANDGCSSTMLSAEVEVIGVDEDLDGYDSVAAGGADCDDGDPAIYPGAPETVGDGVDSDCDGEDSPVVVFEDSYSGGGYTVYRMGAETLPAGHAATWYQAICEAAGMRPVSCDPAVWGGIGGGYDASAYNAVPLPASPFNCNVSSGISGLTGWSNILTFHVPSSDAQGVCENGCTLSGLPVYPICTDY
jgi:hypothetical protein